ncbi:MAG: sugar phosphate isomerase/epimerase family protein [Candidatus Firestonebacteria bacterium]
MKLSVFTVVMPEFSFEEMAKLISNIGYDGIELRVRDLPEEVKNKPYSYWGNVKYDLGVKNLKDKAKEIRKICDKYKLKICAIASYLGCHEPESVEEICKSLSVLDCKMIRVGTSYYDGQKDYNSLYKEVVNNFETIEKVMKKYKAKALVETHMNTIVPSASLLYRVVSNFNPKYIGIIYDPGNMVYEGYENYKMGLELLGGYLSHVHIKNMKLELKDINSNGTAIWQAESASVNSGCANLEQFISILQSFKYNNWLSIEDFSNVPTKEKLKKDYNYLKKIIGKKS